MSKHPKQWLIKTKNLKRIYDTEQPAKRYFCKISKEIQLKGNGNVILKVRQLGNDHINDQWIEIRNFILN
jgi:hypothetical protein